MPLNQKDLFIHQIINKQGPALLSKIDLLKKKLAASNVPEH